MASDIRPAEDGPRIGYYESMRGAYPLPPPPVFPFYPLPTVEIKVPDSNPLPPHLRAVLYAIWESPFKTRANQARKYVDEIAQAAALGYITTQTGPNGWSNTWRITPEGLRLLNPLKEDNHVVH